MDSHPIFRPHRNLAQDSLVADIGLLVDYTPAEHTLEKDELADSLEPTDGLELVESLEPADDLALADGSGPMNTPVAHTSENFENTRPVTLFEEQVETLVQADKTAEDIRPVILIAPHDRFALCQAVEPDHFQLTVEVYDRLALAELSFDLP